MSTEGGRVFGVRMNYGYHMSKAGAHSSGQSAFREWVVEVHC